MCNLIKNIKNVLVIVTVLFLTACNGFFEKDNTPAPTRLTSFTPEVKPRLVWSANAGSGSEGEYLKMNPAVSDSAIYTTSANGKVTAINRITGGKLWQVNTQLPIISGPAVGDGIVVVGSRKGDVLALQQIDGRILWRTSIPGEILSKPAVDNGVVVVKAVDGYVRALSVKDGNEIWASQQVEPNLILRGASAPVIRHRDVLIGFANGNLAKFSLQDGRLFWMQPIAFPEGAFAIQRMIDIDASPVLFEHRVYAATYQGKISSLDWASGRILWSHDISSFTGMQADSNSVYISDAQSHVWSFNANSGLVEWRQNKLEARIVSAPAIMGNYVVVGDGEGYLHWLSKRDGHFAGRVSVGSGIYASPIVVGNVLYALTSNGKLLSYTLTG